MHLQEIFQIGRDLTLEVTVLKYEVAWSTQPFDRA